MFNLRGRENKRAQVIAGMTVPWGIFIRALPVAMEGGVWFQHYWTAWMKRRLIAQHDGRNNDSVQAISPESSYSCFFSLLKIHFCATVANTKTWYRYAAALIFIASRSKLQWWKTLFLPLYWNGLIVLSLSFLRPANITECVSYGNSCPMMMIYSLRLRSEFLQLTA